MKLHCRNSAIQEKNTRTLLWVTNPQKTEKNIIIDQLCLHGEPPSLLSFIYSLIVFTSNFHEFQYVHTKVMLQEISPESDLR